MKRNTDGSTNSDEHNLTTRRNVAVSTDPTKPPVEGARLAIVQNGENAGLRYWALYTKDLYGNSKNVYFEWIDDPVEDRRKRQDADMAHLKDSIKSVCEMVCGINQNLTILSRQVLSLSTLALLNEKERSQ